MSRVLALLILVAAAGPASARPDDAKINGDIASCQAGTPDACTEAAKALDEIHVASRLGYTPAKLRDHGAELLATACAAGSPDACYEHGKLALRGSDPAQGTKEIEHACDAGSGRGCLYLAQHESHAARATILLDKACELGNAHGCELLAERDPKRALELHRKACDGDDALGCTRSGEQRRSSGDRAGAFADFSKACDLHDLPSCDDAGVLAADPAAARDLFGRACDADIALGCSHLAELIAHGLGGERNWGNGLDLAERACTLLHAKACPQLAALRKHPPEVHCDTDEACRKLCDERIGAACRALGDLREASEPDSGAGAYRDACDAGDGASCFASAQGEDSLDGAGPSYERACQLGERRACMYADAARALGGSATARDAMRRACTSANPEACTLYGIAVATDAPAKATTAWRTACERGSGAACRRLAMQALGRGFYGVCDCDDGPKSKAELEVEADQARRERDYDRYMKRGCELHDAVACADQAAFDAPRQRRLPTTPAWE